MQALNIYRVQSNRGAEVDIPELLLLFGLFLVSGSSCHGSAVYGIFTRQPNLHRVIEKHERRFFLYFDVALYL